MKEKDREINQLKQIWKTVVDKDAVKENLQPENNQELIEISEILKNARAAEGISAEEFGRRIGMTQNAIGRLESKLSPNPSLGHCGKIAKALAETSAIKEGKINLTEYKSPFAMLIKGYLADQGVTPEPVQRSNSQIEYIAANLGNISQGALGLISDAIAYQELREAMRIFLVATITANLRQGFGRGISDILSDMIDSDFGEVIDNLYMKSLVNIEQSHDLLITVLTELTKQLQTPPRKRSKKNRKGTD